MHKSSLLIAIQLSPLRRGMQQKITTVEATAAQLTHQLMNMSKIKILSQTQQTDKQTNNDNLCG